jgi:ribose 5-phosphate isomerase B
MFITKKIVIASDHAGFELKKIIIDYLSQLNIEVLDKGTYTQDSVDYPDYAKKLARSIENNEAEYGILICGSANGISIAANKFSHIRAAICWNVEIAKLARLHNDANVLSLPARFVETNDALNIVEAFFSSTFEGGRHAIRVAKIC